VFNYDKSEEIGSSIINQINEARLSQSSKSVTHRKNEMAPRHKKKMPKDKRRLSDDLEEVQSTAREV